MKRDGFLVVGAVLLLATASCAIVSGLSSLDVDDSADASIADVVGGDVIVKPDGSADATSDTSPDVILPQPDAGFDAVTDAPADVAVDVPVPSIQCGSSMCPITSTCCHKVLPQTFSCLPGDASTCSGQGNYVVSCDALSCKNNQLCCIAVIQTFGTGTACAAQCGVPSAQMCSKEGGAPCNVSLSCLPSVQTFPPYDICK